MTDQEVPWNLQELDYTTFLPEVIHLGDFFTYLIGIVNGMTNGIVIPFESYE